MWGKHLHRSDSSNEPRSAKVRLAGDPAAVLIGDQQHVFAAGADGNLKHGYWSQVGGLRSDVWGSGVTGRPSVMVVGDQQHVFARGIDGTLRHWFWEPRGG